MKTSPDKKVLILSHELGRSGAPVYLINLIAWLKGHSRLSFELLARKGGVLREDFALLARTHVMHSPSDRLHKRPVRACIKRLRYHFLKEYLIRQDIGLVYMNSVSSSHILEFLSFLRCPVICNIHELEYGILCTCGGNLGFLKRRAHRYVAASGEVKNNLVTNHGIDESKIDVIHAFINASFVKSSQTKDQVRRGLRIPNDALVVCMSAAKFEWRKGPDIFVQLAREVNRRMPAPVYFLWVGDCSNAPLMSQIMHDIKKKWMSKELSALRRGIHGRLTSFRQATFLP